MSRRFIVPVLALILLLGTHLPAAAAVDAPSRCGQIGSATPVGQWVSGTIDSATDVDWYRFAMPEHANVQLLLGGLPANYRMDVYRQCGDTAGRHFRDYQPGTQFEELILSTSTAPFVPAYVRISGVSGASSAEPYRAAGQGGPGRRPERPVQPHLCRCRRPPHRGRGPHDGPPPQRPRDGNALRQRRFRDRDGDGSGDGAAHHVFACRPSSHAV